MSDRFELRGVVAPTLMLLVMAGCGGGDGGSSGGGAEGAVWLWKTRSMRLRPATSRVPSSSRADAPSMDVIDMTERVRVCGQALVHTDGPGSRRQR